MFIKVSSPRSQFYGAIYYHESKVGEGKAEAIVDMTYESSATMKAQYLESVTKLNPRVTDNRGYDIAVAFHPEEQLTDEEMRVLALEVLNNLQFTDTPYVVYRHLDKPHGHFHIVVPSVRMDGSKVKEWKINERAKDTAIKLEKKYSLRHTERVGKTNLKNDYQVENYSLARAASLYKGKLSMENVSPEALHDKSLTQLRKEYGRENIAQLQDFFKSKGMIDKSERQQLMEVLEQYRLKTYSYSGFEKALANDGFYVRKLYGDNLVYRLPNGKFQFNASKISKTFTYQNLEKYYQGRRGAKVSTSDQYTKRLANRIFNEQKTIEGFVQAAYKNGIAVQFATYQDGRAYGISFTNMKTGEVLKGSQVGLSLNKILKKYQPSEKIKNKTPIFYPSVLKEAKRMADKLGYMLEQNEQKRKRDR